VPDRLARGDGIDFSMTSETYPAEGGVGFVLLRKFDTTTSGQPAGQPAGSSETEGAGMGIFSIT
jgi:hypothetical protein